MKKISSVVCLASLLLATSCSGVRESSGTFTAHGECLRVFGFAIPRDDQQAALDKVPEGATITTVGSTPADWTSFAGIFGKIIGFHSTSVSGTK
jgi:hypothetical protein